MDKKRRLPTCDVCSLRIEDAGDGQIIGHAFGNDIRRLYDALVDPEDASVGAYDKIEPDRCARLRNGMNADFVDAVTRCYFVEFSYFYQDVLDANEDDDGYDDTRRAIEFTQTRLSPEKRLPVVLERFPADKDLWLVAHPNCIPDESIGFRIALSRIDAADKAIEWTLQLSEKPQWDGRAWSFVLLKLFGRIAC